MFGPDNTYLGVFIRAKLEAKEREEKKKLLEEEEERCIN